MCKLANCDMEQNVITRQRTVKYLSMARRSMWQSAVVSSCQGAFSVWPKVPAHSIDLLRSMLVASLYHYSHAMRRSFRRMGHMRWKQETMSLRHNDFLEFSSPYDIQPKIAFHLPEKFFSSL